jgi:Restriction endonuclease XhoI
MTLLNKKLSKRLRQAIQHFWQVREQQAATQGGEIIEGKDRGQRGAVTGGKQMDGFILLIHDLLVHAGLASATIYCRGHPNWQPLKIRGRKVVCDPDAPSCASTELPGWFRPEKDWDLLVVLNRQLVAALEFKSQVGPSFGNNFNNRTEEALGNAVDLWAAYREGAFAPSQRPWLGYLILLEDSPRSTRPVRASEPHFKVFPEFQAASYARRYELLLTKLVRERLYDSACFLMSSRDAGLKGKWTEPNAELRFQNFAGSLLAHAVAAVQTKNGTGKSGAAGHNS